MFSIVPLFDSQKVGARDLVQNRKQTIQTDVVIVGAGPVGLGLALDLAQFGIRSHVLERSNTLHSIPKGQNLTQRTGEHFRRWGVGEAIRQASPIPRESGNAGMVAYGNLLGAYHYDWFKRATVNPFYFAENERLPQYETEKVLRARADSLDAITVHTGCQVVDVAQHDGGVTVRAQTEDDDMPVEVTASYCVGCDGSRSRVRDLAGIRQTFAEHEKKMVLLVFKSARLDALLQRYPGKSIYNVINPDLDGYWQFFGRVDLAGTWFHHSPVPADTNRDNFDFEAHLHGVVGEAFPLSLDHIGFWDLRIAVADTYRNKRIFIAGDAAHSHPPYGGYGVNLGFEDARNLSWKLAARLQGWGSDALLDSYSQERRAVFQSTSRDFIIRMIEDDRRFNATYAPETDLQAFEKAWVERASVGNADVTQYLPHYEGSPVISTDVEWDHPERAGGAKGNHMTRARMGHHLAPVPLSDGRALFDALGDGFCLISLDGDAAVEQAFVAHAAHAAHAADGDGTAVPFTVVRDRASDERMAYGARYILVRPDHFVAWAGDDPGGQEAAIFDRALGRADDAARATR